MFFFFPPIFSVEGRVYVELKKNSTTTSVMILIIRINQVQMNSGPPIVANVVLGRKNVRSFSILGVFLGYYQESVAKICSLKLQEC